jgi:hypothetical protein
MMNIIKYILEGLAVAVASHLVTGGRMPAKELILMGLTAGMTFLLMDVFSPSIAVGVRQGSGFGIGFQMVGAGDGNADDSVRTVVTEETRVPYKLVDGMYAAKDLLPGYNEYVKPYNTHGQNCSRPQAAAWPWQAEMQYGGSARLHGGADEPGMAQASASAEPAKDASPAAASTSASPAAASTSASPAAASTSASPAAASTSTAPAASPAATSTIADAPSTNEIIRDRNYRMADVLYSGDIVDIQVGSNYLQRGLVDSQILVDKALPKVGTNLSQLRFVSQKHASGRQTPLNYGDVVYLKHNIYYENKNLDRFVKFGERLQSHQTGSSFREFKIMDAARPEKTGPINLDAEVILARGDQPGDKIFLKVESDKTVSSQSTQGEATRFKINLRRVFELQNRNLCVCPNEMLFP